MKNKVVLGLWGLSDHSKNNVIPSLLKNKNFELRVIYSRSIKNKKNNTKYKITNDLNYFLKHSDLDCVYICLPIALHFNAIKICLINNLHVICEKPITNDFHNLKILIKLAKSKNLIIFESLMYQYHPSINKLKNLVKRKNFSLLEIDFCTPTLSRESFKNKKKYGASAFWDIGYYNISLIQILFSINKLNNFNLDMKYKSSIDYYGSLNFQINKLIVKLQWGYGFNYINKLRISSENKLIEMDYIFSKKPNKSTKLIIRNKNKKKYQYKPVNQFDYIFEIFYQLYLNYDLAKKEMKVISNRINLIDSIYKSKKVL